VKSYPILAGTPKYSLTMSVYFVILMRIQQGTRKVFWRIASRFTQNRGKRRVNSKSAYESQSSKQNLRALWWSGWLCNTWHVKKLERKLVRVAHNPFSTVAVAPQISIESVQAVSPKQCQERKEKQSNFCYFAG